MSTTFYGYFPATCEHITRVEIGHQSAGWEFLYYVPDGWSGSTPGVSAFGAWFRQLFLFETIKDEYGREFTPDQFLEEKIESQIEAAREHGKTLRSRDDPSHFCYEPGRYFYSDGCCFGPS